MQPNQIITSMSGFTADFFGALQTTLTDNSLNNSKFERSLSNVNKSLIMRQLRQQSAVKISQYLVKLIKIITFEQIFVYSLKRKRKENKTTQNIYKHFYKIQLTINMKNRSIIQNAFYRLVKFTQQYKMADIKQQFTNQESKENQINQSQKYQKQCFQIQSKSPPTSFKNLGSTYTNDLKIKQNTTQSTSSKNQVKQNRLISDVYQEKNSQKANNLIRCLQRVFNLKKIGKGFKNICQYEHYLNKKQYLIELLILKVHEILRPSFLAIQNQDKIIKKLRQSQILLKQSQISVKQSQISCAKSKKSDSNQELKVQQRKIISEGRKKNSDQETILKQQKVKQQVKQQSNTQSYGLQHKIKFKKALKKKQLSSQEYMPVHSEDNYQQMKQLKDSKALSGLKFNKFVKKKSQNNELKQKQQNDQKRSKSKKNSRANSNSRPTSRPNKPIQNYNFVIRKQLNLQAPTIAKSLKIKLDQKSYRIEAKIYEEPLPKLPYNKIFKSSYKQYHLAPQSLKNEVPDMQDQQIIDHPFQENRILSEFNQMKSSRQATKFVNAMKLDQKKPLQFSNKKKSKSRSKVSSAKSKNSNRRSQDDDIQPVNIQSLKSYYFPQQNQYGRNLPGLSSYIQSTKCIGSSKWKGNSKKKVSTQVNIRQVKSNQKLNPYLQQLKSKQKIIRKPTQRIVSLHKMIQKSLSAKSSSKISKQDSKKLQKQYKDLIISPRQYKSIQRNFSPQSRFYSQYNRPPSSNVPKQWHFLNKNTQGYVSAQLKNTKQSKLLLQFQKNNNKI